MKKNKILKVGYTTHNIGIRKQHVVFSPKINIAGAWLQKLGFLTGDFVRIIAADGFIQIIKTAKGGANDDRKI